MQDVSIEWKTIQEDRSSQKTAGYRGISGGRLRKWSDRWSEEKQTLERMRIEDVYKRQADYNAEAVREEER